MAKPSASQLRRKEAGAKPFDLSGDARRPSLNGPGNNDEFRPGLTAARDMLEEVW